MINDSFEGIKLPKIKKLSKKLLSEEIESLTSEQVQERLNNIFETIEKLTGKQIVIDKNELPIKKLIPKKK